MFKKGLCDTATARFETQVGGTFVGITGVRVCTHKKTKRCSRKEGFTGVWKQSYPLRQPLFMTELFSKSSTLHLS